MRTGRLRGRLLVRSATPGVFCCTLLCICTCLTARGELYLQKRSAQKKLLPLTWDTSVGGHVDYGESVEEALLRETREELGIVDAVIKPLFTYLYRSATEYEQVNAFYTVYDGEIRPDKDEIAEGRFYSFSEINEKLTSGIFTPNFCLEFKKVEAAFGKIGELVI